MKVGTVLVGMIFVLPVLISPSPAADIQGRWIARAPDFEVARMPKTQKGGYLESFTALGRMLGEIVFDFKVDGTELTGTVTSPQGETAISEGKIDGDEISFAVTRNIGGQEIKTIYRGRTSLNEIRFTSEVQGEIRQEFTAKREFQRHNDIPIRRPSVPMPE